MYSVLPSGLKTGCQTESECPRSVSRGVSAPASHTVTVPSRLVDTMVLPSGLNCSQIGLDVRVPFVSRLAAVRRSISWIPSSRPIAALAPSGLRASAR